MKKLIILIAILIQTCTDKEMEENLIGTKIRVNYYTESCTGVIIKKFYLIQEVKLLEEMAGSYCMTPLKDLITLRVTSTI